MVGKFSPAEMTVVQSRNFVVGIIVICATVLYGVGIVTGSVDGGEALPSVGAIYTLILGYLFGVHQGEEGK